jgi:PKHD-type hydroxylase
MPFHIPKYNKYLSQYCHISDVFSAEEVEKIIDLEDLYTFQHGVVGNGVDKQELSQVRDCQVSWIKLTKESHWLYEKFANLTSHVNQDHFLYDIDFIDEFQYTVYKQDHHYTWHIDNMPVYSAADRKISATILLSDPEEYEGGEFEVMTDGSPDRVTSLKPKKGDVVFFSSWMPHRVKPVISGTRKSLVAWVMGKRSL